MVARQMWGFTVVVIVVVMVHSAASHRTKECQMTPSNTPDKMDVSCNCMQRLTRVDVEVSQLTINQTGCARVGLEVKWSTLETEVAPSKLVLVGARVYFDKNRSAPGWPSSITAIHFINCSFLEVPSHAFQDLQQLEEVRMFGGAVAVVRRGAFSRLPRLRVVEAVNASLGVLEGGAWANLPAVKDIALVHCSIGEIQTLAINLTRSSSVEEEENSCGPKRGPDRSRVLDVLSDRQRTANAANFSLPEYGSNLLLFNNSIELLQSRAFTGDAFGFLIMGSNAMGHMAPFALDLELHNPCEISAAILEGNKLAGVEDRALAGLRGRQGASLRTFFALTNNTWSSVAPQAFALHQEIILFTAGLNSFRCRCDALQWTVNQVMNAAQQDLQEALVAESVCQDDTRLESFILTCHDSPTLPSPSITSPFPPTDMHTSTHSPPPTIIPSSISSSIPTTISSSDNTFTSSSATTTAPTTTLTPEPLSLSSSPNHVFAPGILLTLVAACALF